MTYVMIENKAMTIAMRKKENDNEYFYGKLERYE